jgi:hypothetical protein
MQGLVWRCALTGRKIAPEGKGTKQVLRLDRVLDIIPVGVLIASQAADSRRAGAPGRPVKTG